MRNSVLFLYPDRPFQCSEEALEILVSTGLIDIAEREVSYIILPFPVSGESWSEADLELYFEAQYYLAGGDVYDFPSMQYERRAFNNLQYIIAQGRGATFVHTILSRHARRIAGILTFGGEMEISTSGPPLPAYLVNAPAPVVSYYKTVNDVSSEPIPGVFENSVNPLKKVITTTGGDDLNADRIADAWRRLFSRTARVCITDNVVLDNRGSSEWILMPLPDYQALDITRLDHIEEILADGTAATWYEFTPNGLASGSTARAPLVIALNGMGGDPVYEAESNGWVAKASEKNFIVIAPEHSGPTAESEKVVMAILEYAKATYPIDEERIYLAGYSMGGATTAMIGLRNPDIFAAIAPMGATGYADNNLATIVAFQKDKTDLPFVSVIGMSDDLSVTRDAEGIKVDGGIGMFKGGLKLLMDMNGLGSGDPDYHAHPFWGYPTSNTEIITARGLNYHVSYMFSQNTETPTAKFVLMENAGHCHSDHYATLAWDFFSMFSRTSGGQLIVSTFDKEIRRWPEDSYRHWCL
jgi:pimeloyl-ACP methyl ester carboxylesterase